MDVKDVIVKNYIISFLFLNSSFFYLFFISLFLGYVCWNLFSILVIV